MPHVQITWVEGRSAEQKRKIAERVTAVLIEDGKAKRENIHVSFHDVPASNLRGSRRARSGPKAHALSKIARTRVLFTSIEKLRFGAGLPKSG